jgi:hypothetical protein
MSTTRSPHGPRAGLRLLIAISRLRAGEPPRQVAEKLRLPTALVTLISDELNRRHELSGPARDRSADDTP